MPNQLLTKREVAKLLNISTRTLDRYRAVGGLKTAEVRFGKTVRFRESGIQAVITKGIKV